MSTVTPQGVKSYTKLFIGGSWVEPSSDRRIDVISPVTEEVIAQVPEAQEADVDRAVEAARRAFDEGPWPRMSPAERAEALLRVREEVEKRFDEMALSFTHEIGAPFVVSNLFHQNALKMWNDAATLHKTLRLRGDPRHARRPGARGARAGRRRGDDHPVERPGRDRVAEDRPGARRRLPGDPQAGARGAGQRDDAGRGDRGRRAPGGRGQHPAHRARGRRVPRHPPRTSTRSPSPAAPPRAGGS